MRIIGEYVFVRLYLFDSYKNVTISGFHPGKVMVKGKWYKEGEGEDNWHVSYVCDSGLWVSIGLTNVENP